MSRMAYVRWLIWGCSCALLCLNADLACAVEKDEVLGGVWLISTRAVDFTDSCSVEERNLTYHKLNRAENCWRSSSASEFCDATQPKLPTIFVVHGNRYNADEAIDAAEPVYQQLNTAQEKKPYRLVIWSWPSEKVCRRNRPDVQSKAQRAELESFYLAECLNRIPPKVPLNLIGFSFGSRIITGAIHLLGGGELGGQTLENRVVERRPSVNAILVAAAVDSDWLLPGHYHGKALGQLTRLLVTQNCRDTALRWYPAMYHRGGSPALGFVGPECCGLEPSECKRMEVLNLTCAAGKTHDWLRYAAISSLQQQFTAYTFAEAGSADQIGMAEKVKIPSQADKLRSSVAMASSTAAGPGDKRDQN